LIVSNSNDDRITMWLLSSWRADQSAPVTSFEQTVTASLGDTSELNRQAAEVGEPIRRSAGLPKLVDSSAVVVFPAVGGKVAPAVRPAPVGVRDVVRRPRAGDNASGI
jgi:hypothetical protein